MSLLKGASNQAVFFTGTSGNHVAVRPSMMWSFSRGDERLQWEVRRSGASYQLCLQRPDGTSTIQNVESARDLLERVHEIPRALLTEGWRPVYTAQA
jgi:hypothetical protein